LLRLARECLNDLYDEEEETDELVDMSLQIHGHLSLKQLAYLLFVTRDNGDEVNGFNREEVMVALGWTEEPWNRRKDESRTVEGRKRILDRLKYMGLWPSNLAIFFNTVPCVSGALPLTLGVSSFTTRLFDYVRCGGSLLRGKC